MLFTSHKAVILSEAPRGSIALRTTYGAQSKDPEDAYFAYAVRSFSTTEVKPVPSRLTMYPDLMLRKLPLVLVALLAITAPLRAQITVSFPATISPKPLDGRVLLLLSTDPS